jgi:D-aminopeptidase
MADINEAIEGAFSRFETHITVADNHGKGGNFLLEALDKRAV